MNIYYRVTKPYRSNALRRIDEAIASNLPDGFKMVEKQNKADVTICPIVNINDTKNLPDNYIIWQLCYLTAYGELSQWMPIWNNALMVTSYLNLPYDNYLRLPLGYDPELFNTNGRPEEPRYDVLVTGYVDEEKEGEVIQRLIKHFPKVMHVGEDFKMQSFGYYHANDVSDTQMASLYRNSKYVAGMRLKEGFELPIIEGAACGCKPITLDMECYRHWFEGMALFVDPEHMDNDLAQISTMPENVNQELVKQFTWDKVMKEFWNSFVNEPTAEARGLYP